MAGAGPRFTKLRTNIEPLKTQNMKETYALGTGSYAASLGQNEWSYFVVLMILWYTTKAALNSGLFCETKI